jgi:hypothetical protein
MNSTSIKSLFWMVQHKKVIINIELMESWKCDELKLKSALEK